MSNESSPKTAITSVAAVEQYIALRRENCNRHRASVLVHANGKDCFPDVRVVSAKASEGTAEIIIEDFHTIFGDRSNRFTVEESSFYLIGKTLQIKSKDNFDCPITVEITGV